MRKNLNIIKRLVALLASLAVVPLAADEVNLAAAAKITSSSSLPNCNPEAAADGVVSDESLWLAAKNDKAPGIELTFPKPVNIDIVDVFSGWKSEPGLENFDLTFETEGKQVTPPQGKVRRASDNISRSEIGLKSVSKIRLTLAKPGPARIREIAVYKSQSTVSGSGLKGQVQSVTTVDRTIHHIAINQVGYETSKAKRFTAPLRPDGTSFVIRAQKATSVLHQGKFQNNIGDFSASRPEDSTTHYVIEVRGSTLKDKRQRIEEVAYASIDHVRGRNPRLSAAPCQPEIGFPEVERGWPKANPHNVCARLELCRGSISSLPGSEMYPFNPEVKYRQAEGWVNYGASWCISLASLTFDTDKKTTPVP